MTSFLFVFKRSISEFRKLLLKIVFSFALKTWVNKLSHLCYSSQIIKKTCLKKVDGKLLVPLLNIQPNAQRLWSLK